ncbi:TPA: hypothetical protein ACGIK9_003392 [Acinetobacter baumannii]|uniref:hypothetical protein n=1 Tax=Acinetobacter baumannii TaxID=470 RepID=UPI00339063F9
MPVNKSEDVQVDANFKSDQKTMTKKKLALCFLVALAMFVLTVINLFKFAFLSMAFVDVSFTDLFNLFAKKPDLLALFLVGMCILYLPVYSLFNEK